MQGGTISSAIHALALAARSMSRPSPTTGSLTRGNGRGVADFWPAASRAAPEAQYIPKRGGFWGVRHCRGQRTHRPRQSPVRMRGWGGVWLGRQVCHWARKSSPLKNADENCSLGKKSKAAEVRLKSYLHDLRARRRQASTTSRCCASSTPRAPTASPTRRHLLVRESGCASVCYATTHVCTVVIRYLLSVHTYMYVRVATP